MKVDRAQVMAYRIAVHGLHRDTRDPTQLAVFDLGVRDSQRDAAVVALSARLAGDITAEEFLGDDRFALAWTHRGAPQVHRTGDLSSLAAAMVPVDDADAAARLSWDAKQVTASGMSAGKAITTTARAIHDVVRSPMAKGEVSAAVTERIPEGLTRWCDVCRATHVHEQLMRLATLPAGVRLVAGASPATLAPLPGRRRVVTTPDLAAATRTVAAYLRLHGPCTTAEPAGFVGTTVAVVKRLWPDDTADVEVDGRHAFVAPEQLKLLGNPPEPDVVRLLSPGDPLLQARDRNLLMPNREHQRTLWKSIGNPGAILAGGEIAATWRAQAKGRQRLAFTIAPLRTLKRPVLAAVQDEARRVATARGYADVIVSFT